MSFDASSLSRLPPSARVVALQKAVRTGTLTASAAVKVAAEHGLDAPQQQTIASTRFSGLAYAQRQITDVFKGPGALPATSALFRGLLKTEPRPAQATVAFGASSVTVPADIAERINERIAYVSNGASGNEALDEELSHTNCRGAAATVLFGSAGNANWGLEDDQISTVVKHRVYGSCDELKAALRSAPQPAVLMLGSHEFHTALFLGFDEDGQGIVFQKGNMSSNYPWELMSLEQLFDTYCVPDNHGHEQGLRIAKPKL